MNISKKTEFHFVRKYVLLNMYKYLFVDGRVSCINFDQSLKMCLRLVFGGRGLSCAILGVLPKLEKKREKYKIHLLLWSAEPHHQLRVFEACYSMDAVCKANKFKLNFSNYLWPYITLKNDFDVIRLDIAHKNLFSC